MTWIVGDAGWPAWLSLALVVVIGRLTYRGALGKVGGQTDLLSTQILGGTALLLIVLAVVRYAWGSPLIYKPSARREASASAQPGRTVSATPLAAFPSTKAAIGTQLGVAEPIVNAVYDMSINLSVSAYERVEFTYCILLLSWSATGRTLAEGDAEGVAFAALFANALANAKTVWPQRSYMEHAGFLISYANGFRENCHVPTAKAYAEAISAAAGAETEASGLIKPEEWYALLLVATNCSG